jgi:PAS domain S-box-containing protein
VVFRGRGKGRRNDDVGAEGMDFRLIQSVDELLELDPAGVPAIPTAVVQQLLRRQAEQAVRETKKQFLEFFERAGDGILLADPETRQFRTANRTICTMLGYSAEQLLELRVEDIHPAEALPLHAFERLARGEIELFEEDISLRRSDGSILDVDIKSFPVSLDGNRYMVAIFRDISERKRLQEAVNKRMLALTRPLDRPDGVAFEDLFDLKTLQRIQDEFSAATGVASIITAPDGTPITEPSNFTALCMDVIRGTDKGRANCFKSDAALGQHNATGPMVHACLSGGLWDAGANIEICGRHVANWLIGQVRDETQTEESMRVYAREIGADETVMIDAFRRVPSMSRAHFEEIAQALFTLVNQLSTSAYLNVQQARFIAAQQKAEQRLHESEEKYRNVFESESDAILIFDEESRCFVDVNAAAMDLYGYSRAEFLRLMHSDIITEPDLVLDSNSEKLTGPPDQVLSHRLHQKKDGSVFRVEVATCSFFWKGQLVVCEVIRDVTERVIREEELLQNRKELRRLASELSLAEQRGRERIAAELHDSMGQLLSSANLRLNVLREAPLPKAAAETLETVCDILERSLQQTRSLTFELCCPMLNELGLAAALQDLCEKVASERGITCTYQGDIDPLPLPLDQQVVLYRWVRELMINVMKHSEARRARVQLKRVDDNLWILVEDDGKGFDASAAGRGFSPSGGFGLFNIREYLQHAGGELEIDSTPGKGTRVTLKIAL